MFFVDTISYIKYKQNFIMISITFKHQPYIEYYHPNSNYIIIYLYILISLTALRSLNLSVYKVIIQLI